MNRIKHYLSVYQGFLQTSLAEATSFRAHFFLVMITDLIFYLVSLSSVGFIYNHVSTIGIWDRSEFLFFLSFMLAVDHLHMTFISQNFWEFSFLLRTGKLDFLLLKPIGSIFSCFFQRMRPSTILNGVVPWSCLVYFGNEAGLPWTSWILIPFLILLALALLVALEILLSTLMFVTIESYGINFLRMQFQSLSRWPDFVYRYYFQKFFTVFVPILLIGSIPVKILFGESGVRELIWMISALLVVIWLTRIFWWRGLKRYESASS